MQEYEAQRGWDRLEQGGCHESKGQWLFYGGMRVKRNKISLLKSFNYVYPERCEKDICVRRSCCMAVKCCCNGVVRSARLYLSLVLHHFVVHL